MKDQRVGYFYAILASLMWGSTAAVSKSLLDSLSNIQVLFFSSLFATLALFGISLAQGKLSQIRKYGLKDYAVFAFMGFVGVFLYRYFLQAALIMMPAQEAFIINYTWPIMVVVFAWLMLKEPMTPQKLLGLALSFIGVVIVTTKGDFSMLNFSVGGVLFALAGAVAYGYYSVLGKRQNYDKYTSTMLFYVFALLYASVALAATSSIPSIDYKQLSGLIWLGVFPSGLAFAFWLIALQRGDTAKISNLIFLTPFISLIYIYVLLGEHILASSIIGLLCIVFGILIQSIIKLPRIKAQSIPPEQ